MFSYDNNLDIEIHHRLLLANRCYHGLKKQMKPHYVGIKMKCKLYKTLIRPVLLYKYVCETWAINRYEEEKISIFETKVLRKIYGPTCDNGRWRISYNNKLYQLFGEPDVIIEIKATRVKWLGHLYTANKYHPCRMLTFAIYMAPEE
jgi:hypothetical protein